MARIRISTTGMSVYVDLDDKKVSNKFFDLVTELFKDSSEALGKETNKSVVQEAQSINELVSIPDIHPLHQAYAATAKEPPAKMNLTGYKGFLYIKCRWCGETKGFCSKERITGHRCSCDGRTDLEDLKQLYINCECGGQFKYLTNITDDMFDMNCLNCGNPVAINFNENKQIYETIK